MHPHKDIFFMFKIKLFSITILILHPKNQNNTYHNIYFEFIRIAFNYWFPPAFLILLTKNNSHINTNIISFIYLPNVYNVYTVQLYTYRQ